MLRNVHGKVNVIIGRFDIGLSSATENPSRDDIETAVTAFLASHTTLLGAPNGLDATRLRFGEPFLTSNGHLVVEIEQTWHGLRLVGADLSAVLTADNYLLGLNGTLSVSQEFVADANVALDEIIDELRASSELTVT